MNKEVWICTSREITDKHPELVKSIEKSGAKVVCDTCMVVSPATEKYKTMMVNSGKALAYVPGMCGVPTLFGDIYKCIREAVKDEGQMPYYFQGMCRGASDDDSRSNLFFG